ncbi:MAG: 30S ribosomal protein S21 [Dehalococcoidia bacterium]|nr:30S ribosomal protein S21 [Dehalococcoidia bacterium]MDZ4246044.1 30S ribosomal protein S21 [Dehalococcoidia bacterium]
MSFEDRSMQCSNCGAAFTFSAKDQEYFQSKSYTNEPKRCPECRQARKSEGNGRSSYGAPRQSLLGHARFSSLEVRVNEGESQESLLRRFQRMVQMSGVLREVKANRHFVPKSEAARIKSKKNAQRRRRQGN